MTRIEKGEINIAVMAPPKFPVSPTGGAEIFTGSLANALAEEGFPVRLYGLRDPSFNFVDGVTYVETGKTADDIMAEDKVGLRKGIHETGVAPPLQLAMDIAEKPNAKWAVVDNDITTACLSPYLKKERIPHLFIQHATMTTNTHSIYQRVRACGSKVVAIADQQRETAFANFGDSHDVTIKNGIDTRDFQGIVRIKRERGEPIRIGTLSRIEPNDTKGIGLAIEALKKLQCMHDAHLTIAGPLGNQNTFDSIIGPHIGNDVSYVGTKNGIAKGKYLADTHIGAALSNPGGWSYEKNDFTSRFAEVNSLTLHEMTYCGVIPVSSDSGGAEAMRDAGLAEFIVPLDVIAKEGLEAFTTLVAQRMLRAANHDFELSELQARVRTMEDTGKDYGNYILKLIQDASGNM